MTEQREAENRHISPDLLAALTEPGASTPDESIVSHLAECRHCTAVWAEFVRARTQFSLRPDADMPPESLLEMAKRIPRASSAWWTKQRVAAALAPIAATIVFVFAWQSRRHELRPIVTPDQKRAISERLRQDSHGGLLYDGDQMPRPRGTRGSAHDSEGTNLEPLLTTLAGVPPSADDAWWFVADLLSANRLLDSDVYLQESLQSFPEDARFHNLAAILAFKRSDLATAEAELRAALNIERNDAHRAADLVNLARVLQEQEKTDEAKALQAEVLRRFPDTKAAELTRTLADPE